MRLSIRYVADNCGYNNCSSTSPSERPSNRIHEEDRLTMISSSSTEDFKSHETLLLDFARRISDAAALHEVTQAVIQTMLSIVGQGFSAVFRLLEAEQVLERLDTVGLDTKLQQQYARVALDAFLPITDAVRQKQMLFIQSQEDYVRLYPHLAADIRRLNIHGTLCFPFFRGEQVTGALFVAFTQQRKVSERQRELLFVIALLSSQALAKIEATRQLQDDILEQERKRLARELHDAVSQALFSATSLAETLPQLLTKHYASGLEQLNMVIRLNRAALSEMRILLLELRPESLLKSPLSALVRQLIEGAEGRKMIEIEFRCTGKEAPLPPELHLALYRIVQEALNNIVKHSEARRAVVILAYQTDALSLQILDDVNGFDPAEVSAGMGIMGMRERARALGLTFELKSQPGHGAELRLQWRHTLEK